MAENMTEMSAEQEQEARALDEIREEAANRAANRHVHPALIGWLAARGALFSENVRGDLQNAPERHPDVRMLKRLLPQSSFALYIRLAWLCWRARQIAFFAPQAGYAKPTWAQALESADARDSMHDEAFEARVRFYAERPSVEQRREEIREEEEALALTLMRLPTTGKGPAVDIVETKPVTPQDKAQEQANANLAAAPPRVRKPKKS